jgi:hypothetical protein
MKLVDPKIEMYKKMFEEAFEETHRGNANLDNVLYNALLATKSNEELMFMLTPEHREDLRNTIINKLQRDEH